MDELSHLFADGLDDAGRAVAQQVAAPSREEVEIAVPLGIPDPGAFAPDETDRISAVIRDHVPLELGDRLGRTLMGDLRQGWGSRVGRRIAGSQHYRIAKLSLARREIMRCPSFPDTIQG
jgi:hypothetical protein